MKRQLRHNLEVVSRPEFDVEKMTSDLVLTAVPYSKPEVTLVNIKKLKYLK